MLSKKIKKIIAFSLAIMIPLNIANPLMQTLALDRSEYIHRNESQYDIENGTSVVSGDISNTNIRLSNIEFAGGTINGKFDTQRTRYDFSLTEESEYFAIKAKLRNTGAAIIYLKGPNGEIYPIEDGEFSENIPAPAVGTGARYELRTRRIGNGEYENFYNIRVFRTDGKLILKLNDIEQLNDGTKQLKLDVLMPAGNNIATCNFGFKFDNKKLQIIDKNTKQPIKPGARLYDSVDLHHLDEYGNEVWQDYYYTNDNRNEFENLNTKGQFSVDFGVADFSVRSFAVTEANNKFMTIYFKVLDDSFDLNTIYKSSDISPQESVKMVYYLDGLTSYTAANPDMLKIEGLVSAFDANIEKYKNGEIIISPEKSVYSYGEAITVSAKPNLGYAFTSWAENPQIENLVGDPNWRSKDSFTFKMPKHDLRLDIRLENGFSKVGLDYDKSDIKLDFNAPYSGNQVLVIADPYKDGEFSGATNKIIRESYVDEGNVNNIVKTKKNTKLLEEKIFRTLQDASSKIYVDKKFVLKSKGLYTNIWVDSNNAYLYEGADINALQKNIDDNYKILSDRFGNIYDVNSNGKLDIIMYDIPNHQSLFDINQLIGDSSLFTSAEDVIHLNINDDVDTLSRKMSHEMQHIIFASNFKDEFPNMTEQKYNSMVPKWIDEGLSLMAEWITLQKNSQEEKAFIKHHIQNFNNSSKFANGEVSLTNWENSSENDTLVYMFFSYITSQSSNDILKNFYKSYEPKGVEPTQVNINDAISQGVMDAVSSAPNFTGMDFKMLHESFWIATFINDKTGIYGFRSNTEFENISLPINKSNLFDGTIKNLRQGAAKIVSISNEINTNSENNVSIVGIQINPRTLTIIDNPNSIIDISPDKQSYNKNEVVTLTVKPNIDYKFASWSGDVEDIYSESTKIIMSEDKTVSVNVDPIIYNNISYEPSLLENGTVLITDENGNDVLNGSSNARLVQGTVVTISANPNERFKFASWSGDNVGNEQTLTLTMDRDIVVTPIFEPIKYVNINYQPSVNGIITAETIDGDLINDSGNSFEIEDGTSIRLIAKPNKDYKFIRWEDDYSSLIPRLAYDSTSPIIEITPRRDLNIKPIFEKIQYSDIAYINNTGAVFEVITQANIGDTIDGKPTKIEKGTRVNINLLSVPENFKFVNWQVNNKVYEKQDISIDLDEDKYNIVLNVKEKDKVKIVESERQYAEGIVKILDENDNQIIPGTQLYEGTVVQYVAESNPGSEFVRWEVMQDGEIINPKSAIIREPGFLSLFRDRSTNSKIRLIAKLGLDVDPVFATKSTIEDDEPYLGNLVINEPVNRRLIKVIRDEPKQDIQFDSRIATYQLYLKEKDEFVTISPKVSGEYPDVNIILDNKEKIKVTNEIQNNGYKISKDTSQIVVEVEPKPTEPQQESTYYIIDLIKISDNRAPKVLVGYQAQKDTNVYEISVELQNTALNIASFVIKLPENTEILRDGIPLTTYNTSKDTSVLRHASGIKNGDDFDIQNAVYNKADGKLSLTFNKNGVASDDLEVLNRKAFSFMVKLPNNVNQFTASILANDKGALVQNIIYDYRLNDGVYDNIYLEEKTGATIFLEVSSINDRYNDGDFDTVMSNAYNNNAFRVYLQDNNTKGIYEVQQDSIYYNSKDSEGRYSVEFTFRNIPIGEYTLYIDKYQHLPIINNNILVKNYDILELKPNKSYYPARNSKSYYLIAGDINDDGRVNVNDRNMVRYKKYNGKYLKEFTDPSEILEFQKVDINNDGVVNIRDYNIVMSVGYGKGTIKD